MHLDPVTAIPVAGRELGWDRGRVPEPALHPMTDEEADAFLRGA